MSEVNKILVKWREWGDDAFAEARNRDKPILLDIGAVWCHWCHVMDTGIPGDPVHTGTYSNPNIAAMIEELFIPIKVDNDKRPDINARYNMGGWPTTAFLTPNGDPLYGETYVTPDRMRGLLKYISEYYRDNRGEIEGRINAHTEEQERPFEPSTEIDDSILRYVTASIKANFDPEYGGFGTQPKFPHSDVLMYALERYRASGDEEFHLILEKTLDAMAGGGTYDQYAGGFFRYSTMRDWSIPHFEKMLEDNAKLSRVYLIASYVLKESRYAEIARDVHCWLFDVMYDQKTGTFAGSQDADKEEAYYGLPVDERQNLPTPFIDWCIYSDWNSLTVSALVERYRIFHEESILSTAVRCYDFLRESLGTGHYFHNGATAKQHPLLVDMTAMIHASLDLADVTGASIYIEHAEWLGQTIVDKFQDWEEHGFWDIIPDPNALGALAQPKKEIGSNADACIALFRLANWAKELKYRINAEKALRYFEPEYRRLSFFAANYARAVAFMTAPEIRVVLVGDCNSAESDSFRRLCWTQAGANIVVEFCPEKHKNRYPASINGMTIAYVCIGDNCNAADTLDALAKLIS